ncbi:MAG: pyrroloquinoline quinone biosynthesis protein PqqE [candidate division TA06 bacterium ADurb.Bin417]|uniref:Pyrroloquinoline quinone biosynthesis protein PqqE n=1 Tax=candidate division TA06 bacterium ADurb.Bin417 TaxID=1852828 RepID=A0A1V5MI67_UNCT6|nr:MAG: pyrroloquinoline quinone biosynthesis protein PqqE [candidate division TA06 bacterium ADurb.Bin417]
MDIKKKALNCARSFKRFSCRVAGFFRKLGTEKDLRYVLNIYLFDFLWNSTAGRWLVRKSGGRFPRYPVFLEIEVTTRCNLKCLICEHTYWKEPSRDMSLAQFRSIVDQFRPLCWIGLTGIGESFINPAFLRMLEYVKRRKVFVELYDTFYFIDRATAARLIDLKVDKMFVSLDAATRETYERIRCGSDFERVVRNIRTMMELKRERKASRPEISFHFIANRLNYLEIPDYVDLIASLCGNTPVRVQFTRMLHQFQETADLFIEIPPEIIAEAGRRARGTSITLIWNEDVPAVKPPISRCTAWTMPFIFVTGEVISCCASNEANARDFQKAHGFGNIFEKSFREIWDSGKYRDFRKRVLGGRVPAACVDCPIFAVKPARRGGPTAGR